ncbi:MAG TPA: LLM class flavin-dependent oxidoreductase, partial [Acetobacteraceae bacterium]|nr:LLM class flavin-dependent oxidoreductase [Acetobacteraceae bacterium]
CESLGYARYWLAEHHNSEAVAGAAPEVLMAAIAATTRRIRIGSAGIMLPHYAALKVAEQFRVLDAIAPGRIDMGLGRAPGSDGLTAHALNPNAAAAADHFPALVRDLLAWVSGAPLVERHPFRDIRAQPAGETVPEPWILGSSDYGAQVAAHFGLPYCFAHFITDGSGAAEALALYRDTYRPSARFPAPHASVCVWALAAETEAEAERLYASRALWRLHRDRGVFVPTPSPEEAAAHPWTEAERLRADKLRGRAIVGTGAQVAARLEALAAELGVQEVAVLSTAHDPAARRRSYALLAEAAGLRPEQVALAAE